MRVVYYHLSKGLVIFYDSYASNINFNVLDSVCAVQPKRGLHCFDFHSLSLHLCVSQFASSIHLLWASPHLSSQFSVCLHLHSSWNCTSMLCCPDIIVTKVKSIVYTKMKINHHLFTLVSLLQTCMTFFLRKSQKRYYKNVPKYQQWQYTLTSIL